MTQILITVLLALALDRFLPDRGGFDLIAWYRDWAESIEQRFNGGLRSQGIGAVLLALGPIVLGVLLVGYVLAQISPVLKLVFDVVVLYLCLDLFRLGRSAESVSEALEEGDVYAANERLNELTGKHATEASEAGIARDAVEAVLKRGNSLVIAPLFWFIMLGPAGALLQRLACVLDKLWGHRDTRFAEFGWAAARLDDLLGWIPARVTALSYAMMGSFEDALHCWRRQAGMWSDINSGPLLASGFGAMHMSNCEDSDANEQFDPLMARGISADAADVRRVVALVWRVLLFWLAVAVLMSGAHLFGLFAR